MAKTYSILLLGLSGPAESFASNHLTHAGQRVLVAGHGAAGVEALKDPQINLVFLCP